jgi:hypothetical protein
VLADEPQPTGTPMTETEWNECADPTPMLDFLRGKASDRKLRLFAVACCRRIWHYPLDVMVDDEWATRVRNAVVVGEKYADREATEEQLKDAYSVECSGIDLAYAFSKCSVPTDSANADDLFSVEDLQRAVSEQAYYEVTQNKSNHPEDYDNLVGKLERAEFTAQANLLRDIFGPVPFRPVTLGPSWLTTTVKHLAEAIYTEKAFDRLPILADALEDAGCNNQDILNHLRGGGEHCRGCWAVDLILGKE